MRKVVLFLDIWGWQKLMALKLILLRYSKSHKYSVCCWIFNYLMSKRVRSEWHIRNEKYVFSFDLIWAELLEEERNANCKRVERETSSQSVSIDHKFMCSSKMNIKSRTNLKNVSRWRVDDKTRFLKPFLNALKCFFVDGRECRKDQRRWMEIKIKSY